MLVQAWQPGSAPAIGPGADRCLRSIHHRPDQRVASEAARKLCCTKWERSWRLSTRAGRSHPSPGISGATKTVVGRGSSRAELITSGSRLLDMPTITPDLRSKSTERLRARPLINGSRHSQTPTEFGRRRRDIDPFLNAQQIVSPPYYPGCPSAAARSCNMAVSSSGAE